MIEFRTNFDYQQLIDKIGITYQSSKSKIISAVNTEMLYAYWQIGKDIVEFEQGGKLKAEYGTIRELRRQKKIGLFHRIAIGKDEEKILELSRNGQVFNSEEDFIKNPHIFEFMNFPENYEYTESDVEKTIINNLQHFLLELGKGFAFIGRQQRITLNNRHYFVDLVFYHIKLKCYVLIDLKIGEVAHEHIGQMNLYLGYYASGNQ
jgi:predicted nuclease of restriction endonuclease-like (RecB) superfamily